MDRGTESKAQTALAHTASTSCSSSPSPAGLTLPGRGRSATGTKSAGPKLASGLPTCAKSTHACPCVSILGPQLHKPCKGAGGPGFSHPGKGLCVPPGTTEQPPTGPAPYWALKTPGGSGLVPISVLSPVHPKLVHSTSQIPLSVQSAPLHSSPIHQQCLALQSLPDKVESLQTWLDPTRPGSLS